MDNKDRPIKVVKVSRENFKPPIIGNMDQTVFGEVTKETRDRLISQVNTASIKLHSQFHKWENIPAVLKVTLKEDALAKSHRPVTILSKATCPIIGTLDFGEILVSATLEGISKLNNRIAEAYGKKAIANISAIEKIEAYSESLTDSIHNVQALVQNSKSGVPIKLHLFDHKDDTKNQLLIAAINELTNELNIPILTVKYTDHLLFFKVQELNEAALYELVKFIGTQSVRLMPAYLPMEVTTQFFLELGKVDEELLPPPQDNIDYPIIGVIDSGVCDNCKYLEPWIYDREEYVPKQLQNTQHGTMVAGLIAGSRTLNYGDELFPSTQAKILDVPVFEVGTPLLEEELIRILDDVIPKYPEINIWNLSLAEPEPSSEFEFSDLSCYLDEIQAKHNCLFVIASGNHTHLQQWPQTINKQGVDRVASPGDSIRALTVGAIANKHNNSSLSKTGEPSPFSRKGPGPCFIPKPEVSHFGGNCNANQQFAQTGVLSIGPNDSLIETIGTSFATPLVSSQAATIWKHIQSNDSLSTPEKVKALLIHSALLGSNEVTNQTINHYGFGQPNNIESTLYCDKNLITFLFDTDLLHGGYEFERWPFPVAECLYTDEGKFKGEVFVTVVYSPLTDSNYKSEYCRTNVEVGLGKIDNIYDPKDKKYKLKFIGLVPPAPKKMSDLYEKQQIDSGFKWSPVKAYHKRFRSKDVSNWRLKMKVIRRAELDKPEQPQPATLLVSFRSYNLNDDVYNESIISAEQENWEMIDIDQDIRIKVKS